MRCVMTYSKKQDARSAASNSRKTLMATKKLNQNEVIAIYLLSAVIAVVFSLYHYVKLRKLYLTGPQVRQVFDIGSGSAAMLSSGFTAVAFAMMAAGAYSQGHWTAVITVPLGMYLLYWVGKVQAYAFMGVVVDYPQGRVMFPPTPESLDLFDYIKVMPVMRHYASMDSVALAEVQRITRQAGKSLFLHGDFGSKRITFTNKLKRDECIHLITANGSRAKVVAELE